MKVSIIIPFFNQNETLRWTIQSAVNQTHKSEIIIVDDGSTDKEASHSANIFVNKPIHHYMKPEPFNTKEFEMTANENFKVLHRKTNSGVVQARNNGACLATGDFLVFLDADDWIDRTYVEKTVAKMTDGIGIVYSDMHVFSEEFDRVQTAEVMTLSNEAKQNSIPISALVRRSAFEQVGGFKEGVYEDWLLWVEILNRDWETAVVNEPLFHYRAHTHSSSRIGWLKERHDLLIQNMKNLHPELF
jgi:glycosyltransferase involved in cell wall biosynthesis